MIPINAPVKEERAVRRVLESLPGWYVNAARIGRIETSTAPDVRDQVALYDHEGRVVRVFPGMGDAKLRVALAHELGHGCDDYRDNGHYFSSSDAWIRIHAQQSFFDHPKYGAEALEYFADIFGKIIRLGESKLAVTCPYEVKFFSEWVIPELKKEFK